MSSKNNERAKENLRLALLAQGGNGEALDELCDNLYYFMLYIATRKLSRGNIILKLEVASLGRDGVISSLRCFDHEKSSNFSNHCFGHIKNVMEKQINARIMTITVPIEALSNKAKCLNAIEELTGKTGMEPTVDDIAKHVDITVSAVKRSLMSPSPQSMEYIHKEMNDDHTTLEDFLEDHKSAWPDSIVDLGMKIEYVMKVMGEVLNEREFDMILKLHGVGLKHPWTLSKISDVYDLTPERVRQIILRSKEKIREAAEADGEA